MTAKTMSRFSSTQQKATFSMCLFFAHQKMMVSHGENILFVWRWKNGTRWCAVMHNQLFGLSLPWAVLCHCIAITMFASDWVLQCNWSSIVTNIGSTSISPFFSCGCLVCLSDSYCIKEFGFIAVFCSSRINLQAQPAVCTTPASVSSPAMLVMTSSIGNVTNTRPSNKSRLVNGDSRFFSTFSIIACWPCQLKLIMEGHTYCYACH